MIPHVQDNKFISHGVKSNNQFKLLNNSSIMDILSNRIYSDKFAAVLREIGCNAYDAHVASGKKNRPFDVILPTNNDLRLIIRDYGSGLKPDDVIELYTTYGFSSKTDSNDYVGFMGIGSKSPFCYTSTFEVNSYYNGKKHSFLMFKDDENIPNVNHFSTIDTNEENGLEVIIPIIRTDVGKFSDKAKEIYGWFDIKPNIKYAKSDYNSSFTLENKISKLHSFHGVFIVDNSFHNSYVKMGNVVYLLDKQQIPLLVNNPKHFLNNIQFVIEFNIGEVEVDSGREKLQYTKNVIRTIEEKLKKICADIEYKIHHELAQATKPAIKKKICSHFFEYSISNYDRNGYHSFGITEFKKRICKTFNILEELLNSSLYFTSSNFTELPIRIKEQKNGKKIELSEDNYPQNTMFKVGSKYSRKNGSTFCLDDITQIDLLRPHTYLFYKEGTSFKSLREFIEENYPTRDNLILPSRFKDILIQEFDIKEAFTDIVITNFVSTKVREKRVLTFPVKTISLSGFQTSLETFTPLDNTLYIVLPFKYNKIESEKVKTEFTVDKFRDKLGSLLKAKDILNVLTKWGDIVDNTITDVQFLVVNSKNKKQIDENDDSYLALDKFIDILSLDDKNKKLYPSLDSDDLHKIFDLFLRNKDSLEKVKKSYEFAKKIVPLFFTKSESLFSIVDGNELEKEIEDIEEIYSILFLNHYFTPLFKMENMDNKTVTPTTKSDKKIIKFHNYLSYLNSLEYYLNELKSISSKKG